MPKSPIPTDEEARLAALRAYDILDTPPEPLFDDIVTIAAGICETPIALISLVDAERQWFKARLGLDVEQTDREVAFCAHAILGKEPLVVNDATSDERFAGNPLVTGDPHIRFYAGAPLLTREGSGLGTLCVIDNKPRDLSDRQHDALAALSRQVVALLEYRRVSAALAQSLSTIKVLGKLVPICAYCKKIRDDKDYWNRLEDYLHRETGAEFTHGICPDCVVKHFPDG